MRPRLIGSVCWGDKKGTVNVPFFVLWEQGLWLIGPRNMPVQETGSLLKSV